MRKTKICTWTEEWAISYKKEKELLEQVFNEELINIYHIGSTSVPSIGFAKPIIDIMVVVKDIKIVDLYNEQMMSIGYACYGENGIEGRRYFPKGGNNRTHHVHIYEDGHREIKSHLNFKNYLLNHPLEAKAYGELKVELLHKYPDKHNKYQEGKQNFVAEIASKANDWGMGHYIDG